MKIRNFEKKEKQTNFQNKVQSINQSNQANTRRAPLTYTTKEKHRLQKKTTRPKPLQKPSTNDKKHHKKNKQKRHQKHHQKNKTS